MNHLFVEFALILMLGGVLAYLVSLLRQPTIIAYILTGLIVAPWGYFHLHDSNVFPALSQIGVTLLLFMVGMQLDVGLLKRIGRAAVLTALFQMVVAATVMYAMLIAMGFTASSALYLAPAFTFASTIIVVKLLGEKKDLQSLYGKMVIGIHLTQDLIALLFLVGLTAVYSGADGIYSGLPLWQNLVMVLVRSLILLLGLWWISVKALPKVVKSISKNEELMLVFSLAWALGIATLFALPVVGFSLEIGGFLAGLALGRSGMHYEISGKIKPIQDFFIMIFFIVLGSHLVFSNLGGLIKPAILLSLAVLVVNPLLTMLALGFFGYKPRTGFYTSMTVGQVSEFSLILVASGFALGKLQGRDVELATWVAMLTIGVSSYLIMYSTPVYEKIKSILSFFDFKDGLAEKYQQLSPLKDHIILAGAHRLGHHLIDVLKKQESPIMIVDFDPELAQRYAAQNIPVVCGDITDDYVQEQASLPFAKMIISTVPDFNDNIRLLETIRKHTRAGRKKPILIFIAQNESQIKALYKNGVDYVISPHFIGGIHLAEILEEKNALDSFRKLKRGHLEVIG